MSDVEVPPPPLEIPWQLASTTQPLAAAEPDETAISLFVFRPDDEEISGLFPGQQLVFLKLTTTISPAAFPSGIPPVAGAALGEGVPCFHVQLDVKVRNGDGDLGTIRPYFHAAAPLIRRSLQSGVVGLQIVEGESDEQHVGKSGSQLYESSSTRATTTSVGASAGIGIGPVSLGGSVRRTSTDVAGERSVSQVVDTTTRDASQERRELTSHNTKIENVLTLLNAKYLGTPHLRFSLSPRPLQLLSVDPSDPNLWFNELLKRRSSGIEGLQEFTAVVLVPESEDFCVNARLRRVCVLDDPPGPLVFDEPFIFNQHLGRALNYLDRRFPVGTPFEEFDVDLIGLLPTPDEFVRPILRGWIVSANGLALADVVSPTRTPGGVIDTFIGVNYKHFLEVWKETLIDEYEREAARSPLERGTLIGEDRVLDTCFDLSQASGPVVSGASATVTSLFLVDVDRGDLDLGGITTDASSAAADTRQRAFETATRWNLLDERLAVLLSNRRERQGKDFALDDIRVVSLLLAKWAKLREDDPRNLPFDEAVAALHLTDAHRRVLKAAGTSDLRSIAQAIQAAPVLARYNDRVKQLLRERKDEAGEAKAPAPEPIGKVISPKDAESMRRAIGEGLEKVRSKSATRKRKR